MHRMRHILPIDIIADAEPRGRGLRLPQQVREHFASTTMAVTTALEQEGMYLLCLPRKPDPRAYERFKVDARERTLRARGIDPGLAYLIAQTESQPYPRFYDCKVRTTVDLSRPLDDARMRAPFTWVLFESPFADVPYRLELWQQDTLALRNEHVRVSGRHDLRRAYWLPLRA